MLLGIVPFVFLVVLWPRLSTRANAVIKVGPKPITEFEAVSMADYATLYSNKVAKALKMKKKTTYERPAHLHTWLFFMWAKLVAWALVIGVLGDLLLSEGWHSPLSLDGVWYDLIFARANAQPNGAHIMSYLGAVVFGLVVTYKYRPKGMERFLGDIAQGIGAIGFLGAVHELIWITFYYIAYAQYLSWTILPEVIRDVSFVVMLILLVVTFWRYKGRRFSLGIFKWPILAYTIFCVAWFVVPTFFGYYWFPITTINNPQFGSGLYQETPWFGDWKINLIEVFSWVMLYSTFILQVLRQKD